MGGAQVVRRCCHDCSITMIPRDAQSAPGTSPLRSLTAKLVDVANRLSSDSGSPFPGTFPGFLPVACCRSRHLHRCASVPDFHRVPWRVRPLTTSSQAERNMRLIHTSTRTRIGINLLASLAIAGCDSHHLVMLTKVRNPNINRSNDRNPRTIPRVARPRPLVPVSPALDLPLTPHTIAMTPVTPNNGNRRAMTPAMALPTHIESVPACRGE